ncbi:MAG: DUF2293 domain-containing protein [Planctomycetota bacterium]
MHECLILSPTGTPKSFKTAQGKIVSPPVGWECLPPGDAGMTRRVKAAGPSWQVIEKRRNKAFSHGLWAPGESIANARMALELERATPQYAKKRIADVRRREQKQELYVGEFALAVLQFLDFAPAYSELALTMAELVAAHATPVGSGTVARTERIPIDERAEAAIIAWMRHQTTAYDSMKIERVKGKRRDVRRQLAEVSRAVLQRHRVGTAHPVEGCPLCVTMKRLAGS